VRQLRLALKQRDVLVEQLRGDVAALRVRKLPCIVSESSLQKAVWKNMQQAVASGTTGRSQSSSCRHALHVPGRSAEQCAAVLPARLTLSATV
jgi:hypothetical protein